MNVRQAAAIVLEKVAAGAHIQAALSQSLDNSALSAADRRLCADMAYGCEREKIRLNHILRKVLARPEKLPPKFLLALRIGAYGLLAQDRMPAYATINETVNLLKKKFGPSLAGVANGALRNIQRLQPELQNPGWYAEAPGESGQWQGLRIFYSLPPQVADMWAKAYGRENAIALMRRSSLRPWMGLRLNHLHPETARLRKALETMPGVEKIGNNGFAFAPGKFPEKILDVAADVWLKSGALTMQAAGSMLVLAKLGLDSWEGPVWDCCAGFGGKSQWLLQQGVNVEVASDISAARLGNFLAKKSCPYAKIPLLARADATKPPARKWHGHILADVPCSGLGVLARRPDIRNRIPPGFAAITKMQALILEGMGSLLQKGGELAYVTCALNPQENELAVENFLAAHPEMELLCHWQTPHNHPWLEGMYGARLKRH